MCRTTKKTPAAVPIVQEPEIAVPPVCHHDAVGCDPHLAGGGAVGPLPVGDVHILGQEGGKVQQRVELHSTLGVGVQRPVVYLHAEGDKGGVEQLDRRLQPMYAFPASHLLSQMRQDGVVDVAEHVADTVLVLVSERGLGGGFLHAQVVEVPRGRPHACRDVA